MQGQGFLRWERCGVGVPCSRNLIQASVDRPAAVADNARQPMSFLVMVDALPVMHTPRRFRWMGFSGSWCGWGWFRGNRFGWCRLHRLWMFHRLRRVGGFRFRHCGLCRFGRLGGNLGRLSRHRLRRGFRHSCRCGFRGRLGLNRLRWKCGNYFFLCSFFRFFFSGGIFCFSFLPGFTLLLKEALLCYACGCLVLCGIRHGSGTGTSGNSCDNQQHCDCSQDFRFHRISPHLQEYYVNSKSPARIGKFQENFTWTG